MQPKKRAEDELGILEKDVWMHHGFLMKVLKSGHKSIWKRIVREKLAISVAGYWCGYTKGCCKVFSWAFSRTKNDEMENKFVTLSGELKVHVTARHWEIWTRITKKLEAITWQVVSYIMYDVLRMIMFQEQSNFTHKTAPYVLNHRKKWALK